MATIQKELPLNPVNWNLLQDVLGANPQADIEVSIGDFTVLPRTTDRAALHRIKESYLQQPGDAYLIIKLFKGKSRHNDQYTFYAPDPAPGLNGFGAPSGEPESLRVKNAKLETELAHMREKLNLAEAEARNYKKKFEDLEKEQQPEEEGAFESFLGAVTPFVPQLVDKFIAGRGGGSSLGSLPEGTGLSGQAVQLARQIDEQFNGTEKAELNAIIGLIAQGPKGTMAQILTGVQGMFNNSESSNPQ